MGASIYFDLSTQHVGFNLCPLQWKLRVLTLDDQGIL